MGYNERGTHSEALANKSVKSTLDEIEALYKYKGGS